MSGREGPGERVYGIQTVSQQFSEMWSVQPPERCPPTGACASTSRSATRCVDVLCRVQVRMRRDDPNLKPAVWLQENDLSDAKWKDRSTADFRVDYKPLETEMRKFRRAQLVAVRYVLELIAWSFVGCQKMTMDFVSSFARCDLLPRCRRVLSFTYPYGKCSEPRNMGR